MEIKAKNQISIVDVSDGKSVSSVVPEYYLSTSNIELSGGSWSTEIPARTKDTYIWTRSRVEFSNPTETAYTTAVLDNATNNMVAVGSVTETLNAELNIEGNTLVAKAGKLIIESPQLSLDENGNLIINTEGLSVDAEGNAMYKGSVKSSNVIIDNGLKIRVPWGTTGTVGDNWDYRTVLFLTGNQAEGTDRLHLSYGDHDILCYDDNGGVFKPDGIIEIYNDILLKSSAAICFTDNSGNIIGDTKTMTTYTETNITDRSIIASNSGNVIAHKRYNSVTITCIVNSISGELATSNGYVSIGTLPTDCIPAYNIIEYHRFNGIYIGQIRISSSGEVSIGYTKKNDGTAINLPAGSTMYWAFTYTI